MYNILLLCENFLLKLDRKKNSKLKNQDIESFLSEVYHILYMYILRNMFACSSEQEVKFIQYLFLYLTCSLQHKEMNKFCRKPTEKSWGSRHKLG